MLESETIRVGENSSAHTKQGQLIVSIQGVSSTNAEGQLVAFTVGRVGFRNVDARFGAAVQSCSKPPTKAFSKSE